MGAKKEPLKSPSQSQGSALLTRELAVQALLIPLSLCLHRVRSVYTARATALAGLFLLTKPYLLKPSRYRSDASLCCVFHQSDVKRPFSDMLVWTSLIYMVPAIYAVHAHQYGIAAIQAVTSIGSTLFHLNRETRCFNLDNIFAQSLLFTTVWALYLAVKRRVWYYILGVGLGGPLAIYFIVICGMPGAVFKHPHKDKALIRKSNPEYAFFHMLWHIVSGIGTILSIHFFEDEFPDLEAGGGYFTYFPSVPVVPSVALALSFGINLYGNWHGIMPLD